MATFTPIPHDLFKLPDGRIVDIAMLDKDIRAICHYVRQVVFCLKDGERVVAVIFPDEALLEKPDYVKSPEEGCFCPRNLQELGKCLCGCTCTVNATVPAGFARIDKALIIKTYPGPEDDLLTPDGTPSLAGVIKKYDKQLQHMYGKGLPESDELFVMNFNE